MPTAPRRCPWPLAAVLLCTAVQAASAGPWGVPVGRGRVRSVLSPTGDRDSFLVEGIEGGRLTVSVRAARGSAVAPTFRVIGPEGDLDVAVTEKPRAAVLRGHPVATTGLYEIRVEGVGGTTGGYQITARATGRRGARGRRLSAPSGEEFVVPFAASGGGRVRFTVAARGGVPAFRGIEDPLGGRVAVDESAIRGGLTSVRGTGIGLPADRPFGIWRLVLAPPAVPLDGLRVSVAVRGPRPRPFRGVLPDVEPTLASVEPAEAGPGTTMTLLGTRFTDSAEHPLRVFAGGIEVAGPVLGGSTSIVFTFPSGMAGAADVAVLNGDGHALLLENAVTAIPPPVVASISPTRGPGSGGSTITLLGTGFRETSVVTLAGTPLPASTTYVDAGTLRLLTPPFAGGPQTVGVLDPTGQTATAPQTFEFVSAPGVSRLLPPILPALEGESVVVEGTSLTGALSVTLDGGDPLAVTLLSATRLSVDLPPLTRGTHDVEVRDEFGQGATLTAGLEVFDFDAAASLPGAEDLVAADMAFGDYDFDGLADLFLVAPGTGSLSQSSLLRVFRNNGGGAYEEVTDEAMPAVDGDDFRGNCIALGDVAGGVFAPAPDGWPDIVVGTTDTSVLAVGRSRIRILANRESPTGGRWFVDVTDTIMATPSNVDDWWAEDLWVGDLDGDGGVPDIVAVHDELLQEQNPLAPFDITYHPSTRVFSHLPQTGDFAWISTRIPTTRAAPGQDVADALARYRGVSLAVADLDDDGRPDVAVVSPGVVTVAGAGASSVQMGRNVLVNQTVGLVDHSGDLPASLDTLQGDVVLLGDVVGGPAPDLVVVGRRSAAGVRALRVVENRGLGTPWTLRTTVLPDPDGEERLQAAAAALHDVDGDGDLDIVLLTDTPPGTGARSLRILRNLGNSGFDRALEALLPDTGGDPLDGEALVVGDPDDDGGVRLFLARTVSTGQGDQVRGGVRRVEE